MGVKNCILKLPVLAQVQTAQHCIRWERVPFFARSPHHKIHTQANFHANFKDTGPSKHKNSHVLVERSAIAVGNRCNSTLQLEMFLLHGSCMDGRVSVEIPRCV